jgi:CRISPR-associated protein Cas1
MISLARDSEEKIKDLKEIYSIKFEEDLIYTQARRLANSLLKGEEYRPFLSK